MKKNDNIKTVCELNMCVGCGACAEVCNKRAIVIEDNIDAYNAVINGELCVDCNACKEVCQNINLPKLGTPIKWYQGWSRSKNIRQTGSSGGLACEIAREFVNSGGVVCSCVYSKGKFGFEFAENEKEIYKFAGSKYVKSNPLGIYKKIMKRLSNGESVLFIGLPCQVAALKNFVGEKLNDKLYTVDLICHGTPSPKIFDLFMKEKKIDIKNVSDIRFRNNDNYQISCDNKNIVKNGVYDRYSIAFLNSLINVESCYSCKFVGDKRVSDITLGDSWGSDIADEVEKGISLVLCQSEKGEKLLNNRNIYLTGVNVKVAKANNRHLIYPPCRPKNRKLFFKYVEGGGSFSTGVLLCLTKICLIQILKNIVK